MSEWRFLLDENIDPKVATYLDKEDLFAGHVRDTVVDTYSKRMQLQGGSNSIHRAEFSHVENLFTATVDQESNSGTPSRFAQ